MNLPPYWTTVTEFSKTVAVIIFVAIPIVAFYIGGAYQSSRDDTALGQSLQIVNVLPLKGLKKIVSKTASSEAVGQFGSLSGQLGYPSSFVPPLDIYIFDTKNPKKVRLIAQTKENQTSYLVNQIKPGTYYVVAYIQASGQGNYGGGYTDLVLCGLVSGCADGNLLPVEVEANQVTSGVDLTDWSSSNNYPPKPDIYSHLAD